MRVFVESDMTVCPDGHTMHLYAGETVEGPLARYLVASDCDVTVEEDDQQPGDADPEGNASEGSDPDETQPPQSAGPSEAAAPDGDAGEPSDSNKPDGDTGEPSDGDEPQDAPEEAAQPVQEETA